MLAYNRQAYLNRKEKQAKYYAERYQEKKEEYKEHNAVYYEENKEKVRQSQSEYRKKLLSKATTWHKYHARLRKYERRFRAKNKLKVLKKNRDYYYKNQSILLARAKYRYFAKKLEERKKGGE